MPNRLWILALFAAVILSGSFRGSDRAEAGDGSVRFLTAGPVRLGDGHIAHMRVFLPVVQRAIDVHFLGDDGALLKTVRLEPPSRGAGPFFEASFDATFTGPGSTRLGTMSITDGTSNTLLQAESTGIIAILIGLRRGGGAGTLQLTDPLGQPYGILPYIEQDNLFRF